MKPASVLVGVVIALVAAYASQARAQMFGGQQRPGALGSSTTANEGTLLRGNERFIRGNRRGGSFVGNDARARRGFVGTLQGGTTQQVAPAAAAVRIPRSQSANTTAATTVNPATGAYQPRLTIGFEVDQPSSTAVTEAVIRQLEATPGLHPANRIEVSVEGGTAKLRGVVASERDRALIERLVLFEPGISAVRNDLKVMPKLQNPEQLPPSSKSPPYRPAGSEAPK